MIHIFYLPLWVIVLMRFCLPKRNVFDRQFFKDYLHALEVLRALMPERHTWISYFIHKWLEKEIALVGKMLDIGTVGMIVFEK